MTSECADCLRDLHQICIHMLPFDVWSWLASLSPLPPLLSLYGVHTMCVSSPSSGLPIGRARVRSRCAGQMTNRTHHYIAGATLCAHTNRVSKHASRYHVTIPFGRTGSGTISCCRSSVVCATEDGGTVPSSVDSRQECWHTTKHSISELNYSHANHFQNSSTIRKIRNIKNLNISTFIKVMYNKVVYNVHAR